MASNNENPDMKPEDEEAELAPLITPLTEIGYHAKLFTPAAFVECGISHQQFVKLAKCFAHLADSDLQSMIWVSAFRANEIRTPFRSTLRDVIIFLQWLRSCEGQQAVTTHQRLNKVTVKNTTLDIDLLSALNYQITALNVQNKRTREEFEPKIRELQRRIEVLTMEKENKLASIEKDNVPGGRWKEPNLLDFDRNEIMEKVNLYFLPNDKIGFGAAMEKFGSGVAVEKYGFDYAMEKFGDRVRQASQLEFLDSDLYRQELRDWMNNRIICFLENGDLKQADIFNNLLVSIGGTAVVANGATTG